MSAIILWNGKQMQITTDQRDLLLDERYIYAPRTHDEYDVGEGIYYPDDDHPDIENDLENPFLIITERLELDNI